MKKSNRPGPLTPRRAWAMAGSLLAGLLMLIAFVFFIALTLKTPIGRSLSLQDPRPVFDPELSSEQLTAVSQLSLIELERIDQALLANCSRQWRKVARVVGGAMSLPDRPTNGIPDLYYAQRVALLVEKGQLLAQGDLRRMGASEVRLPAR